MAKILLVDDSRTSRKYLKSMLEMDHHEIIGEAANGIEGVEKYKELQPDVTTMDITMPELDGIEALKQIIDYDPDAKVIMVSAMGQKSKVLEAVQIGAKEFLVKPFEPYQIHNIVHHVTSA